MNSKIIVLGIGVLASSMAHGMYDGSQSVAPGKEKEFAVEAFMPSTALVMAVVCAASEAGPSTCLQFIVSSAALALDTWISRMRHNDLLIAHEHRDLIPHDLDRLIAHASAKPYISLCNVFTRWKDRCDAQLFYDMQQQMLEARRAFVLLQAKDKIVPLPQELNENILGKAGLGRGRMVASEQNILQLLKKDLYVKADCNAKRCNGSCVDKENKVKDEYAAYNFLMRNGWIVLANANAPDSFCSTYFKETMPPEAAEMYAQLPKNVRFKATSEPGNALLKLYYDAYKDPVRSETAPLLLEWKK